MSPHKAICNSKQAFTLTELIVVLVMTGIIMGFAIPNYQGAVNRAQYRDAGAQLTSIYAANKVYSINNGGNYWPNGGSFDVDAINANLGTNLLGNEITFRCSGDGTSYECTANYGRGTGSFTLHVTEIALDENNPWCTGNCPYGTQSLGGGTPPDLPPGQENPPNPPGPENPPNPPGQDKDHNPPGQDKDHNPPGQEKKDDSSNPPGQVKDKKK